MKVKVTDHEHDELRVLEAENLTDAVQKFFNPEGTFFTLNSFISETYGRLDNVFINDRDITLIFKETCNKDRCAGIDNWFIFQPVREEY